MAVDWIKMRVDLQSHPKVVRILSAMRPHDVLNKTDKFRVIGGLHAVWSVFDAHCEDGVLNGYTPETLDHVIGWDGFSGAMISVGWLIENSGVSLAMPEFSEHNGQSAKRRAEDQKRKRDSRNSPEPVRKLSADDADKKQTREEKRREDKSNTNTDTTTGVVTPIGVSESLWTDFKKLRSTKKAPITQTAIDGIQREADKAGLQMADALAMCCERGWTGFKAEWALPDQQKQQPETFKERDARLGREKWERMTGEQHPDNNPAAPSRSILDVVDVEMKMLGAMQ